MKEKYGSDAESVLDESDDSEDTEEDEDGEELTPAVDAAILRTLARIKRKDPDIYDSKKDVFEGTFFTLSAACNCAHDETIEEQRKTKTSITIGSRKEEKVCY